MKTLFLVLLFVVSASAQVPTLSPRRLWSTNPDEVVKQLVTRAQQNIAAIASDPTALDRAAEDLEIVGLIVRNTILSDEFNPDHSRVLRFTPMYLVGQLNGIAQALDDLSRVAGNSATAQQRRDWQIEAQTYRAAASFVYSQTEPNQPATIHATTTDTTRTTAAVGASSQQAEHRR